MSTTKFVFNPFTSNFDEVTGTIDLTTDVTGALPIVNGGTGQTTKAAAFDALSPMTTGGDIIYGGTSGTGTRLANGSSGQVLTSNGTTTAPSWQTPSASATTVPTVQKFLSGSGTYTKPTSPAPAYIRVIMVGSGGGGSGGGNSGTSGSGSSGTNTTFGTTLLVANGGTGGVHDSTSGVAGGNASLGTGPVGIALSGGDGAPGSVTTVNTVALVGGTGGNSAFGGAGVGTTFNSAGDNGAINTGGGGGGGNGGGITAVGGCGGGAGGYVNAIIGAPSSTYAYVVGAGGSGGTAGTTGTAGGNGAAGMILVEEYY